MERTPLLPLPEGMFIDQIQEAEASLIITVIATHPVSCCPLCLEPSSSIHSLYRRTLADVPCGGRQIQLALTARKFFCSNPLCERKVFTERLPTLALPWARMTIRHCQQITSIGLATCGKGGVRLAARLGICSTRQSILRRIMDLPPPAPCSVLRLGIDDFSFRRGQWFGTILVDLESHRIIDLLPDRRAETCAYWMRQRPEITAVSRDRGGEYAKAATQGAPQAVQYADRFHLCKNLSEAAQLLLARCQAEIAQFSNREEPEKNGQSKQIISIEEWRPPEPVHVEKVRLARRAGRYARYQQVVELQAQGMKAKQIAQRLDRGERTVRDWLKEASYPEVKKRRKRQSSFDSFAPYILSRWQAGERNGLTLWREIMQQGYTGTERTVYRHLETLKQAEVKTPANQHRLQKFSANTAVWLFVRDPETLDDIERDDLAAFCQVSTTLNRAYDLIQSFFSMVRKREGHRLDAWLLQIAQSDLPELQSFAAGIEKDKDAVRAGLTWSINNGPVEGYVNKLKLIKRTMYGRAGFPLLRQRVLHAL
jgi:transposase